MGMDYRAALWYFRYGWPDYELCETVEDAIEQAVWMEQDCQGVAVCVQDDQGKLTLPDGPEWRAVKQRMAAEETEREAAAKAAPPRPTRTVKMPTRGAKIDVPTDAPSWLGDPLGPVEETT